jgi:hypothetical protein
MTADELQIAITFSGIFGSMFIWANVLQDQICASWFAMKLRITTLVCRNSLEISTDLQCVGALL